MFMEFPKIVKIKAIKYRLFLLSIEKEFITSYYSRNNDYYVIQDSYKGKRYTLLSRAH